MKSWDEILKGDIPAGNEQYQKLVSALADRLLDAVQMANVLKKPLDPVILSVDITASIVAKAVEHSQWGVKFDEIMDRTGRELERLSVKRRDERKAKKRKKV